MIDVTVTDDAEAAAHTCAERIAAALDAARAQRGVAHVALAGGRTPARTYELLPGLVADWRDVHLWFGDERCVPLDDPESNHNLLARTLLAGLDADPDRPRPIVHAVAATDGDPSVAAAGYERELRATIAADTAGGPASAGHVTGSGTPPPVLDLALLGLGEDGHTASLFPDDPALEERERLCIAVRGRKPPFERVTLTLPLLRATRAVVVLTAGEGKAWAVSAMLAGPSPRVPASLLADGAAVELIVDRDAAPQQR
ncbi:MAG TPA: 6-phosphogluconolactonase [Conexibacter sp.]|jgi:6-phosphogluconolactonase|nr:6-phosphogluconolactonase [Conexibacter sp.]